MKLIKTLATASRSTLFAAAWMTFAAAVGHSQVPPAKKALPRAAAAPASSAPEQKYKAIWEPVNYNQDLQLLDVFFVTPDEGWVSGVAGTILHTQDGGKTWEAQLGGDPHSQGPNLTRLFFLDRTHGWAQSWNQLFRTTDGATWQEVGNDVRGNVFFVSPQKGFRSDNKMFETHDGGATWHELFTCHVQAVVDGLTREIDCNLATGNPHDMQFITPQIGFAVGQPDVVAKTNDGGATWQVGVIPLPPGDNRIRDVFFFDENNGFVNRGYKWFKTSDGGKNWQGVIANAPLGANGAVAPMRFADPGVGWACAGNTLTYTSDGGAHWFTREVKLPAPIMGFSLPTRQRGYVVGEHGMIYRYRIVPASYTAAHVIDAPAMPGFDSPVLGQVATLNDVVAQLRRKLPAPAGVSAGAPGPVSAGVQTGGFQQTTDTSAIAAAQTGGFQQDSSALPAGGGYVDTCCGPLVQQLDTTANAFATDVPAFSQRFRNLNLIFQGLSFLNSVTSQANTLKQSIRALRQAPNPQAASLALNTVSTQVNGISSSGGFVQDVTTPPQP
jgi:photosystem II stability/assembly factor-like uncharacterized protein